MKIINLLTIILFTTILNLKAFAADNKDCKSIKADTGVKIYQKIKCKIDEEKGEGLGKKLKNIFKKKD